MFVIGATEKLSKEIHKDFEDLNEYKDTPLINRWHANLITINRRKCLILMNNKTGINLTLFGLRKQQFDNLNNVIKGSLKQLLQLIKVEEEIIDELLKQAEPFVYTNTDNRQVLCMMNQVQLLVEDAADGLKYEEIDAAEINYISNAELYFNPIAKTPVEALREYFQ
ncbi:hypothetical protein [Halobacillus sp. A5]|uniref:DUF6933 domain-containing protein n=1 Tax=Halobacillus sp. A5 TaxID=2880263 RepID=UPI0020A6A7D9|nr:hypothetical protein [Halobacillus sp. A5]MCP3027411.1 hypothetical protein [Halobacillus sp. A5]